MNTTKNILSYFTEKELFVSQKVSGSTYDSEFKFSGKPLDLETGYSYFGARYLDSKLGLWLSVDPMADKFYSTSPYMFCVGNPLSFIDYNGMDTIIFNSKGYFGSPIPDGKDFDTYVKVNNKEFNANKISYNKNGKLRGRHANRRFSKDFRLSHKNGGDYDMYIFSNYSEAKETFEFFSDNTDVEWGHLIWQHDITGKYTNRILTSHEKDKINIPGPENMYTPIDIRHSHLPGGFLSPEDRNMYIRYNEKYGNKVTTRIYKGGYYHNFDDKREYPNLKFVPSYE